MKRYHLIVHGKVQGVGFRIYTQLEALKRNVNGWAKNRTDGTVEIDAEGSNEQIDDFINAIKRGSPFSNVSRVEQYEDASFNHYSSFKIK
ncbi:acylphosphatase [Bacillus solimangrovi]|uniref:Acylphosphatase n=1 Tax=Bacillus solimangrovi TaxID=1305675 RepID=A0A1E5LBG6_9BACI|nr:acylphosphatase [Bacillus solimangrovi]OEH91319.1 acylphosphatase [Bacillus solimangrovi]